MPTLGPLNPKYLPKIGQGLLDYVTKIVKDPQICEPLPIMCGPLISKLSVGPPTVECCPMVSVYLNSVTPVLPINGQPPSLCTYQLDINFQVEVFACYPVSAEAQCGDDSESNVAFMNYEWFWAAYRQTLLGLTNGSIPEFGCVDGRCCGNVSAGQLIPINPLGGCAGAGWSVNLRV